MLVYNCWRNFYFVCLGSFTGFFLFWRMSKTIRMLFVLVNNGFRNFNFVMLINCSCFF
ncbi:hypothetical protein D3C85_1381630 [compost metagenome]